MQRETRLVQRTVNNTQDIDDQFNSNIEDGEIPVVIVPKWSPFRFHLRVPTKCYAIIQRFGKDIPSPVPGEYFKPPWFRVAFIVTTEPLTYRAHFPDCKTMDFISLKVEVMIAFKIIDAQKFVYEIGVAQFDELLASILAHATRHCVSDITFDIIQKRQNNLQDELQERILSYFEKYNEFGRFGVSITGVTVQHAMIPDNLMKAFNKIEKYEKQFVEKQQQHNQIMEVLKTRFDKTMNEFVNREKALQSKLQTVKNKIDAFVKLLRLMESGNIDSDED